MPHLATHRLVSADREYFYAKDVYMGHNSVRILSILISWLSFCLTAAVIHDRPPSGGNASFGYRALNWCCLCIYSRSDTKSNYEAFFFQSSVFCKPMVSWRRPLLALTPTFSLAVMIETDKMARGWSTWLPSCDLIFSLIFNFELTSFSGMVMTEGNE